MPDTHITHGLLVAETAVKTPAAQVICEAYRDHAPDHHAGLPPANVKPAYRTSRKAGCVIREELTRLFTWEERHRRLAARLLIALGLTLAVLAVGSVLIWVFESGV
jgi:hypothetical protein